MKDNFLEKSFRILNLTNLIDEIRSYEQKGWRFELNPNTDKYFPRSISPKGEIWTATKIKKFKESENLFEGDSLDAYNYLKAYHSYFSWINLPSRFSNKN